MDSMWMLYWITRAITMKDVAGGLWAASLFVIAMSCFLYMICIAEEADKRMLVLVKWAGRLGVVLCLFSGSMYILCPTKEEAAVIVAGGAVVEAAKSETAQRLASKSVTILENSLDNILGKQAVEKAKNGKSN